MTDTPTTAPVAEPTPKKPVSIKRSLTKRTLSREWYEGAYEEDYLTKDTFMEQLWIRFLDWTDGVEEAHAIIDEAFDWADQAAEREATQLALEVKGDPVKRAAMLKALGVEEAPTSKSTSKQTSKKKAA